MPTEFKNVYLTEALESIQAEKRVSIQEMDNHTEVLEATLRTKTDNLKEELEANVALAMKVPILRDVNAMKVADGLLDGDVVQLQGYNSAGDGLHHMRKLSTIDDGTGILLPSGLYANYVKDSKIADKLDKTIYDEEITVIKEDLINVKEDVYSTLPIGTILAIGHNEVPLGFLLCDGRTINQSEYPELYRLYGSNIPDYRDMFLRGNVAGREIGSLQEQAMKNIELGLSSYADGISSSIIQHGGSVISRVVTNKDISGLNFTQGSKVNDYIINPTGDNEEVRPKNISVNFIIKATNVVNPSSAVDVAEELNRKMEVLNGQIGELEETSVKALKGENILLFRNGEYLTYKDNANRDRIIAMIDTIIGGAGINSSFGGGANIEIKAGSFTKPSTSTGIIYYDRAFKNGCFAVVLLAEGTSLAPTDSHIITTHRGAGDFGWKAQNNYNYIVSWIAIGH